MPFLNDEGVIRNLSVRLIKKGEVRRAAIRYPLNAFTDEEWLRLRNWLLGKDNSFGPNKILVVNIIET
jgi:hypothetical protein